MVDLGVESVLLMAGERVLLTAARFGLFPVWKHSEINWGQLGSTGANWGQLGPTGANWGQVTFHSEASSEAWYSSPHLVMLR